MDTDALRRAWQAEEDVAHIHGWDFSHISGRYDEADDLPWDYRAVVNAHLRPGDRLLDIDTGGGEFLLSLGHPAALTAATEGYPPNVELCRQTLLPLGIDFREMDDPPIPFEDARFDVVIDFATPDRAADSEGIGDRGGTSAAFNARDEGHFLEACLPPRRR